MELVDLSGLKLKVNADVSRFRRIISTGSDTSSPSIENRIILCRLHGYSTSKPQFYLYMYSATKLKSEICVYFDSRQVCSKTLAILLFGF